MGACRSSDSTSSATAELVAIDQVLAMVCWTPLFLKEQGYKLKRNIVYQDNKRAILLEKNGKQSSGKKTRALYFR
ncbi:MAG: hypothetical protein AAGF12_21295, partial [Myxococcota bacterium]